MLLFLYINNIFSTVLGIDLGSSNIKVSLASSKSPLHLALHSTGNRIIPNVFSFWNNSRASNYTSTQNWKEEDMKSFHWAHGDFAYEQCLRFPKTCIFGNVFNNDIYFNLTGYEITALSLYNMIKSIKNTEEIEDNIKAVISIPPGMKAREKSFLYMATQLAGI